VCASTTKSQGISQCQESGTHSCIILECHLFVYSLRRFCYFCSLPVNFTTPVPADRCPGRPEYPCYNFWQEEQNQGLLFVLAERKNLENRRGKQWIHSCYGFDWYSHYFLPYVLALVRRLESSNTSFT